MTDDHNRRVAFVAHAYPVMSEVFVSYAAAGLIRAGWRVDVVTTNGEVPPDAERHPVEAEIAPAIRVFRPTTIPGARRAAVRDLVSRHGLGAFSVGDPTRFTSAALSRKLLHLADTLGGRGPFDIVHCHFGTLAPPVLALRRAGFFDARVVVHLRGNDISRFVLQNGLDAYGRVFEDADRIVANCGHFRDRAVELGCDPSRIDVVPSGCDVDRFPFAERTAPTGRPVRLLSIGRLVDKKGHDLLIAAMALLRDAGRDATLRIVGEGPLRPRLEAAVRDAGLADRVVLVGALPHSAIAAALAEADVLVAASRRAADGDEDGPVNTVKEAMASGAPVVATRHGGIPELVLDGATGLLCAEGDAAALADAIARMIALAPRWPDLGRAARRRVEERFSLRVATSLLERVYERAIRPVVFA